MQLTTKQSEFISGQIYVAPKTKCYGRPAGEDELNDINTAFKASDKLKANQIRKETIMATHLAITFSSE